MSDNDLQQAIGLAKTGQRAQARARLEALLARDPQNALAWVWLSDLSTALEERLAALQKAAELEPHNRPIHKRVAELNIEMERQRKQQIEAARRRLPEARACLRRNQRDQATDLLIEIVKVDQHNLEAWWLLSESVTDIGDKIIALENILAESPRDAKARAQLRRLKFLRRNPLLHGILLEECGELNGALSAYLAAAHSRHPAERHEARQRLADLEQRIQNPKFKVPNPTMTLLRLAAGPVVLFGFLILIQSGLNPLNIPVFYIISWAGVMVGSILHVLTHLRPRHPYWIKYLWQPGGTNERLLSGLFSATGWLMLLLPYFMFLITVIDRARP